MRQLGRWKHWSVFLLITSTTSVAAYHLGSLSAVRLKQHQQRVPLPTVNGLYIEPQSLNLGEVWESPQHIFRLAIQNVGSVQRTITCFQTTCGCLELDPPGRTIAPGEKAEFVGKLNLMHSKPYQWGVAQWPMSVNLNPVFEGDLTHTPGWEVEGIVRSRFSINTPSLAFEDRCTHEGPRAWQKVRAKAYVPVKSLLASVAPELAEVRVEANAAEPGNYFLFVSPNPSLPIGRFRFTVQLQAVTPDDVAHPCSVITVVGEMQPSSRVVPRMVLLGEHLVPSDAEADVTLRLPAKNWKLDHIETDSTDTLVTQSKAELAEGVRLHIKQRIAKVRDGVSTIRIVVRKPDKQLEIVPVQVRYYGQSGSRERRVQQWYWLVATRSGARKRSAARRG